MHRLITIPASHYCEKARWALERAGIAFEEVGHAPVWQRLASKWAGGTGTVPVLITDTQDVLVDSSDILQLADEELPRTESLYPHEGLDEAGRKLEARFNERLGPHARRLVYGHGLPHKKLMVPPLKAGIKRWQAVTLPLFFPVAKLVIRKLLAITPESVVRSRAICQHIFEDVSQLLEGGTPFLSGERFGALDLTFAALGAILVMPPEYPFEFPPLDLLPAEWRSDVEHFRGTRAGEFILHLYATERGRQPRAAQSVA